MRAWLEIRGRLVTNVEVEVREAGLPSLFALCWSAANEPAADGVVPRLELLDWGNSPVEHRSVRQFVDWSDKGMSLRLQILSSRTPSDRG